MPDVFISYSRRDRQFVQRLGAALEARGKDVWVDWEDIPASSQWRREIEDGIDATDAFLFVISPDSVGSHECGQELDHALRRRKRIVPIVHREVDPAEVRSEAAAINWVYLRDQDPFDEGVEALVRAIDTDLEHAKAHTQLAAEAINWERSNHDRSRLLRGSELQDAERWLTEAAAKQPQPTELQTQFVQASREAARRRGRIMFAGVAFALVVAVALAIVALIQRANAVHQSQVAFSRQLDADAQKNYSTDPELSVLLAMNAVRAAPGGDTEEALRQALGQSHVRDRYTNPAGQRIGDALWSPDGSRLAIVDEGTNRTEIVRPGAHTKAIVLQTPGLDNQINWAAHRDVLLTGAAAPAVWNATTGALIRRFPTRAVQSGISPNGRVAALADLNGVLHLWDVAGGRQLTQAQPGVRGTPGCVVWSPDGSEVAVCTVQKLSERAIASGQPTPETVTVFNSAGHRLSDIREPNIVDQVAFSPDGSRIAVAVTPHGLYAPGTFVYDPRTGARELVLGGHAASAVAFNHDGTELAYAEITGNIVYVYTFRTKRTIPLVGNTGTINSVQFSHTDVNYVVTSADDQTARVFSGTFGNQLEVLAGDTQDVTDATWSPDDTFIATASKDGTARVWTTPVPHPIAQRSLELGLGNVVMAQDGAEVVVAGPDSSAGWVLDSNTLARRAIINPPPGQVFIGAGFSPDGRWIGALTGRPAGRSVLSQDLLIYNRRTGREAAAISVAGLRVTAAAFGHHGDVATILSDGRVDTWSGATGRHERSLLPAREAGQTISYSANGSRLAVSHPDGSIDVLSPSGGRPLTIDGPRPTPVFPGVAASVVPVRAALSPDGRWLASIGGGPPLQASLYLWNLRTGRRRTLIAGFTPLVSVAFNASGTMLAAGDASSAYVWQFPSGSLLQTVSQGASSTYGIPAELSGTAGVLVGFTKAAGTLVTSGDFATRDWRISTGQIEFDAPFSDGGSASPDARRVVVDVAGVLGVYPCDLCGGLAELMADARHQVTRSLTPTERGLYLRRG